MAVVIEGIRGVGVEHVVSAAYHRFPIGKRRPGEIDPRGKVLPVGAIDIAVLRQLRVTRVDHLAWDACVRVGTAEAEVRHRLLPGFPVARNVVTQSEIQGESRRETDVILDEEPPIAVALVGLACETCLSAVRAGNAQHKLLESETSEAGRGIRHQVGVAGIAKMNLRRIVDQAAIVLQAVHETGFERVAADDLGDVVQNCVGFAGPYHVQKAGIPKTRAGPLRHAYVPARIGHAWAEENLRRSKHLLHLRKVRDTFGESALGRMAVHVLASEAGAKFVDECRIEYVGVSDSRYLVGKIDRKGRAESDGGKRGSGPRRAKDAVLARVEQPLHKILALITPLVVDFEREIQRINAASDGS